MHGGENQWKLELITRFRCTHNELVISDIARGADWIVIILKNKILMDSQLESQQIIPACELNSLCLFLNITETEVHVVFITCQLLCELSAVHLSSFAVLTTTPSTLAWLRKLSHYWRHADKNQATSMKAFTSPLLRDLSSGPSTGWKSCCFSCPPLYPIFLFVK